MQAAKARHGGKPSVPVTVRLMTTSGASAPLSRGRIPAHQVRTQLSDALREAGLPVSLAAQVRGVADDVAGHLETCSARDWSKARGHYGRDPQAEVGGATDLAAYLAGREAPDACATLRAAVLETAGLPDDPTSSELSAAPAWASLSAPELVGAVVGQAWGRAARKLDVIRAMASGDTPGTRKRRLRDRA